MFQNQPTVREDTYFVLTSFAHVVVTVLFGELLNLSSFPGLPIIAFAVSSKAFALFAGENERFFAKSRWAAAPLAVVSLAILAFLPPIDIALGVAVLLLYLNYPRFIRARERSPLDVVFHGSRYSLLFLLGYGSLATLNAAAYAAVATVFLFGVTGEILVGLRSGAFTRNTANRMGVAGATKLANFLVIASIVSGSFIFGLMINIPIPVGPYSIPLPLVAGVAMALYIARPVSNGRARHAPVSVRRREIVMLVLLALVIALVPLGARVQYTAAAPQRDYTVNVWMRVFVAGEYPWDVQSIVFNYRGAGSFYYVLLHTDGLVELGRFANGIRMPYLAEARTSYSPFSMNHYEIRVANGTATVYVDGSMMFTAQVQDPGGSAMVSYAVPNQTLWVISVAKFQVT